MDFLITVLAFITTILLVSWICAFPFRLIWRPLGDLVRFVSAIAATIYLIVVQLIS